MKSKLDNFSPFYLMKAYYDVKAINFPKKYRNKGLVLKEKCYIVHKHTNYYNL